MKQEVISKIRRRIDYIENISKLQSFWKENNVYIKTITAHYFSFSNPHNYTRNPSHYDNMVIKILELSIEQIKENLEKILREITDNDYADKYIELLNKHLSFNPSFENDYTGLNSLNTFNENINIQAIINNEHINIADHTILSLFTSTLSNTPNNLQTMIGALSTIELFDLLKNKNENLILIGANGSGKSTFSRQIKTNINQQYNSLVAVIPAQKTFGVQDNQSIPLKTRAYLDFSRSHTHDKLYKNTDDMGIINSEFNQMINLLIAEYQETANRTHLNCLKGDFEKENSTLENVISIWEEIITHIKLRYDGQGNIKAIPENGNEYSFMGLSDGEKNIFYCIASVLLVDKDGYVIVDEPENHLHMSIVNKLWDKLEDIRNDCQFVYLTHNPSFATGRTQAKILWIKKYTPPTNWDYIEITTDEILPQALLVELIGSKKNILFCKGEKDSYDYKLYSILFKSYTIIPVGGHQKAIDYCKAFNGNTEMFNLKAIAIIDKDFYEIDEIMAWKDNDIYTLEVMEVENILCDDDILKEIQLKVHASEDDYDNAKKQIFIKIKETEDVQSMGYTRFKTDKILNSLVGRASTATKLNEELENAIKTLEIQGFYDEHSQLLNEICDTEDYDRALKHYNNKGMLSFVGDKILRDYKNRVVGFIKEDEALQQTIIDKYFKDIPSE